MLIGRVMGWILLTVAVIMASADVVMALGPADYAGILTSDVLTLLTGEEHLVSERNWALLSWLQHSLMNMPAWIMVGFTGTAMLVTCRKRQRRFRFRRD